MQGVEKYHNEHERLFVFILQKSFESLKNAKLQV